MKNRFDKMLALFLVGILVGLAWPARAQSYEPVTVINDVVVLAQAATNLFNAATIRCSKQTTIGVTISASNTADQITSGAINGLMFVRSVDNVNYETNGTYVTWVPQGKNWLTTFTNINTYGAGYIKILFATNAAATGTNVGSLHIAYGVKTGL